MLNDSTLKYEGLKILDEHLGSIDMERFLVLLSRDAADYTKWHEERDDVTSVREYSKMAMGYSGRRNNND